MDDDLKTLLDAMRQQNIAAHAEARRHAEAVATETRRHFDVTAERLEVTIRIVAEAVTRVDGKIDREIKTLREEMRNGFTETQAMIKSSHDDLDRRIRALE